MKEDKIGIVELLVVLMILGTVFVLWQLGLQTTMDACNSLNVDGSMKYPDSWVCANENGRRLTAQEVKCKEFGECNEVISEVDQPYWERFR